VRARAQGLIDEPGHLTAHHVLDHEASIDGIRHVHILEQLRDLAQPLPCKLILIQTHDQERQSRLSSDEAHQLSTIEAHSTEIQVSSSLLEHADIVVDGAQDVEMGLSIILMWLMET